jgi:hypothetical protein
LKSALNKESEENTAISVSTESTPVVEEKKIETTVEEMEAYFIVKSILRTQVDATRVVYRDAQSYFSIILDDNNRKPICRFYFNGNKKMMGVFDSSKAETKIEIKTLDDIFLQSTALNQIVESYHQTT